LSLEVSDLGLFRHLAAWGGVLDMGYYFLADPMAHTPSSFSPAVIPDLDIYYGRHRILSMTQYLSATDAPLAPHSELKHSNDAQ
jgi:hypothetical protein